MFDYEYANQCSPVPTYTLEVHNIYIALYRLGSAQDDFACSLSIFYGVQCSVVSHSALSGNTVSGKRNTVFNSTFQKFYTVKVEFPGSFNFIFVRVCNAASQCSEGGGVKKLCFFSP